VAVRALALGAAAGLALSSILVGANARGEGPSVGSVRTSAAQSRDDLIPTQVIRAARFDHVVTAVKHPRAHRPQSPRVRSMRIPNLSPRLEALLARLDPVVRGRLVILIAIPSAVVHGED